MKGQVLNRKTTVLILAFMLTVFGMTGLGYAHDTSGSPHFHEDSTTRSVAENVATNSSVGSAVSAHERGTYGRYMLSGTDWASFTINRGTGQLRTNRTLNYETKTSYSVTVTVQQGTVSPLSDSKVDPLSRPK